MTVCSICDKPVTLDNPILHENGVATHVKCIVPPVVEIAKPKPEPPRDPDPMPFWKPKGW